MMGFDDSKQPVPPALSPLSSVAAQINEREMRMRCLELSVHMIDKMKERGGHELSGIPTPQQIADDLMAYAMTAEHRRLFRERS